MGESFRLLTNIEFVDVEVNKTITRLWAHALLFEKVRGLAPGEFSNQVRGFGTSECWPVFTHWLKYEPTDYELTNLNDGNVLLIKTAKGIKPLFSGVHIAFKDGLKLFIQLADNTKSLDVFNSLTCALVWLALPIKVQRYWRKPMIPVVKASRKWGTR